MKKVIVLGAGRGQLPLIDLFHKYGCYVYVVSPKGNYPGFSKADGFLYADIRDRETVLEFAQKENICGITTDQLDESVPTAAYVAEKMGLPGISYDVALKFTNKYAMRKAAAEAGINVPWAFCVKSADEAQKNIEMNGEYTYPVVIKPVDSSASRGVYKVDTPEDLHDLFVKSSSYSRTGEVIVEQFIKGKEYVVEAFTHDETVYDLIVGHRDYFNVQGTFIPCATVFRDALSANTQLEEHLKKINGDLVHCMGLPFGITHAEYLYNKEENKIYLVEIAARGGGVFISSELIPAACGVNANELLVKEVLGIKDKTPIDIKSGASAYFCYLTKEGTVTHLEGIEQIMEIPGVIKAFFDNIEIGMNTLSIRDKSSRKGPILVKGKTKEECYEIIDKVKRMLDIRVKTKNGEENVLWG